MVHEGAIRFLAETLGGWYFQEKKPHSTKGRPLYCWSVSDTKAEALLQTIRPYLRVKVAQCDLALEMRGLQADGRRYRTKITGYRNFPNAHGTPRQVANLSYSDEYIDLCDGLYTRMRDLNKVGA